MTDYVRKELLEAALDYYEEFIADHQDDPAIGGATFRGAVPTWRQSSSSFPAFEDFDPRDVARSIC